MKNKKVLVVLGGTSGEREVSLDSGRACVKALKKIGPKFKIISENLDFELTNAQKKVVKEIKLDLAKPFSMNRLLQGDVGIFHRYCQSGQNTNILKQKYTTMVPE